MTADERIAHIRQKVKWAQKHLGDFEVARSRFIVPRPYDIECDYDAETRENVFTVRNIQTPPVELALIAGDAIHNLRSCLDHLACQLVLVAGNRPSSKTAFPISANAERYNRDKVGKVEGMSEVAKNAIDAAKPYSGGTDELYWLHALDIADKHHSLIVTIVALSGPNLIGPAVLRNRTYKPRFRLANLRSPLKDGEMIFTGEPGSESHLEFAFDVAFGEPKVVNGKPVLELLYYISDLVDGLIIEFKPLLG